MELELRWPRGWQAGGARVVVAETRGVSSPLCGLSRSVVRGEREMSAGSGLGIASWWRAREERRSVLVGVIRGRWRRMEGSRKKK